MVLHGEQLPKYELVHCGPIHIRQDPQSSSDSGSDVYSIREALGMVGFIHKRHRADAYYLKNMPAQTVNCVKLRYTECHLVPRVRAKPWYRQNLYVYPVVFFAAFMVGLGIFAAVVYERTRRAEMAATA